MLGGSWVGTITFILYHKLLTDDHWKRRGFSFPSRCSLCGMVAEFEHHLSLIVGLRWSFGVGLNPRSISRSRFLCWEDILRILDKDGASQCKVIHLAAILSLLHSIWFARNKAKFNALILTMFSCISTIKSNVLIVGNAIAHGSHLNM